MTNLNDLFARDMAFRDIVIETAARAIGSTSKEFAEEWLMAGGDNARSAKRAAAAERVRKAKDAGTSIGYAIVGREYYPWEAYETLIELLTDDDTHSTTGNLTEQSESLSDANDAFSPESDVTVGDVDANDANATQDSREKLEDDIAETIDFWGAAYPDARVRIVIGWLNRQAAITANEMSHDNPYVGLVRGKRWERTETSDYYCGRCGWKVTDHDSYCPECGGALHKASSKPDSKFDARKTAETPETDAAKGDIRDFADSREKLEADVRKHYAYSTTTLMYPPSANKTTDILSALPVDTVIGWLDRQAEITSRDWCWSYDQLDEEANRLRARIDELRDELAKRDKGIARLKRQRDEARQELEAAKSMKQFSEARTDASHCAFDVLKGEYDRLEAERDELFNDLQDCNAQREQLRRALGTAIDHALEIMSLVNLDGEVIG